MEEAAGGPGTHWPRQTGTRSPGPGMGSASLRLSQCWVGGGVGLELYTHAGLNLKSQLKLLVDPPSLFLQSCKNVFFDLFSRVKTSQQQEYVTIV